jgi:nitrate/TMAO reductase-like tetraheme cytochrome c subunit
MKKKYILILLIIVVVFAVSALAGSEYFTSQPEFCGSCHTIKKSNDSWAESGHRDVKCVDCHFAPGKESILEAKLRGVEHLFASLFPDAEAIAEAIEVRGPSKVSNLGCTTSQCHPGEKFLNRKIDYAENVPFTHKPHDDRIIEGKTLNCGTCHLNVKADDNYTISKETCYLCEGLNHILEVYL